MSPAQPNNSATADLLLAALQELKEMKIEVTVHIRQPGEPVPPSSNIRTTAELLPPVLTSKHIKEFLGISQAKLYEFLNSGSCMLLGPAEHYISLGQCSLNGWKGDRKTRR